MRFRNLRSEDLEGSVDIPGLDEWLRTIGATVASILITAPAGTGKAAAVGRLARRLDRNVVLSNLMEIFDHEEPERQLQSLLRLCEAQRHSVIYLDKLDRALEQWNRQRPHEPPLAATLESWLSRVREQLLSLEATVVFTGRDRAALPDSLVRAFDRALAA